MAKMIDKWIKTFDTGNCKHYVLGDNKASIWYWQFKGYEVGIEKKRFQTLKAAKEYAEMNCNN